MEEDIKVQNLSSYCRTCLAECNGPKINIEQMPRPILQLFKQATGFPRTQKKLFPKWICDCCFYKINAFSEFRLMSKKSTLFLEELVRSYKAQNFINDLDIRKTKDPNEKGTEVLQDVLSESNQKDEVQDLQKESPFENIFLETEIKDRFQTLQQTTEALLSGSAEYSNEIPDLHKESIKVEEKEKPLEEANDMATCKTCIMTFPTTTLLLAHKCDNTFEESFEEVHADDTNDVFEISSQGAERKSYVSSDEDLSLSVQFEKELKRKTCSICTKSFLTTNELQYHMLLHDKANKSSRFACLIENQTENPLEIKCKFGCGKTFSRRQTASTHYKKVHQSKTKTCTENVQETKAEIGDKVTDLPAIKRTTCKICFNNYSSERKLKFHMRLHAEKRPFPCDQCERSFNENYRLKAHITETHENPVEIVCKFGCGKTYRHLETAKKHYYLKHSGVEKEVKKKSYSFVCEHCGRIFKNVTTLREHNYTHLPPEDRPYKCDECNKSFTTKRSYKDHQTRHSGIKKFECSHCGLKKTTRKELKFHMNIHTKAKLFTCQICAKVFNRKPGLIMHQQVVHQGIKKYSCSYCDLSFGKPDTLKHHEMRHTGEKPHKCDICDRSFIQVVALRAHIKTHNK